MKNIKGFTVIEIMIVIAIVALLLAIAVPNFIQVRKAAEAQKVETTKAE